MRRNTLVLFVCFLCVVNCGGHALWAATLLVPSEYPTIQAGLDAAADGDTVLVADGVYSGPGNTWLYFPNFGMAVTVRSENGPANCVIDCAGEGTAFFLVIDEPPTTVVEGFTITNATASAIFVHHDSQTTFIDCVISGNSGFSGAGVLCEGTSSPTFLSCVVADNSATTMGGGVVAYAESAPTLIGCSITGNSAPTGGGVALINFSNNATIIDCAIAENVADGGDGGGLLVAEWSGSASVVNCQITDNTSNGNGGGAFVGRAAPAFENCTFAGNSAGIRGGGIGCVGPSTPTVTNSVLWGNTAPDGPQIAILTSTVADSSTLSVSYCAVEGGPAAALVDPGSVLSYGPGNFDVDPLFVPGPQGEFYLSQIAAGQALDSPCVDTGDPGSPLIAGTTRTDLELDDGVVDLGFHYPVLATGFILKRGDANGDGGFDISDAVLSLSALFVMGTPAPSCTDAADSNDDGQFDISDPIYTLASLFVPASPPPPSPFPGCGPDPTVDALDCVSYPACP